MSWFLAIIVLVVAERIGELVVARGNARIMARLGAVEFGAGHYPVMVTLHVALLVGAPLEAWLCDRPFLPWLGWPALALVLGAQALRWWCIRSLGAQWNTRILVAPSVPLVSRGPYTLMNHPNYLAVIVEGFALPLIHTAWITAAVFTVLNAMLLHTRIVVEDRALGRMAELEEAAP